MPRYTPIVLNEQEEQELQRTRYEQLKQQAKAENLSINQYKKKRRIQHTANLFGWTESETACAKHLEHDARHQAQQRLKHKNKNHAVLPGQLELPNPPVCPPPLGDKKSN